MKKLFMLTAIAMMATVGMSARENAHFVAPKNLGEVSNVLLDSSVVYMEEEDNKTSVTIYSYDEELRQVLCQEFDVDEDSLTISSEKRTFYDEKGVKKYVLGFANEGEEGEAPLMVLEDSTVFSYGADMEIAVQWDREGEGWLLDDSLVTQYNAAGKVIRETEYYWEAEWQTPAWDPAYLTLYYYTNNTRLDSMADMRWKDTDWEYENRTIVTYDNNGLRIKDTYDVYNSYTGWGFFESTVYTYDEADILIADTIFEPSGEGLDYRALEQYSYDQWGNVFKFLRYKWNLDESKWEFSEASEDYYSDHTPSAIEIVNHNHNNVKFFKNGQLYIRRGDITYDAKGQVVK